MLALTNISKSFNDKDVLKNVTFSFNKEVVGLIGPNGSGKTTIFKIINGEVTPDGGTVQKDIEVIGYLPQNPQFNDLTVEEFLSSQLDSQYLSYKTSKVLDDLGLSKINMTQKADDLSGGQKTRLYLALLLLNDPELTLLLLDEPTNNLDIEALQWLETFVRNFRGGVLLTSHDRYFLDRTAGRILELSDGQIKSYGGNYSFYKEQKLLEEKAYLEKYKKNVEEIKRLERLINDKKERILRLSKDKGRDHERFEAGFFRNRATKKVSGVKRGLESRLEDLEKVEKPIGRISYPSQFLGDTYSDKFIIGAKGIVFNYSNNRVLDGISFIVSGAQHIWLSGKNGSGKTTLLKVLAGKLIAQRGEVELGKEVKVGYFSQDSSELNIDKTGLEDLQSLGVSTTDCFKYASNLHLLPEDLRKPIHQLSRGQVAKLEFVKLLLAQNNILILDEPTNHLEIETREEIEDALRDYKGSILVASHDRYFLEEIGIDRQLIIENGKIKGINT